MFLKQFLHLIIQLIMQGDTKMFASSHYKIIQINFQMAHDATLLLQDKIQ